MGRRYSLTSVVYLSALCIIVAQVILYLGYVQFWSESNLNGGCGSRKPEEEEYYVGSLKKQVAWLRNQGSPSDVVSKSNEPFLIPHLPIIYAVTPTYARPTQMADLTRLAQTLINVPNFHWILVEDAENISSNVSSLLRLSGIFHTHLSALTPPPHKLNENDPNWLKPRGVSQRNRALNWLVDTFEKGPTNDILYFADDDNTYSLELFEEMRRIKRVGVWPVGLSGGLLVETPLVENGKVIGWNAVWKPYRRFPIDMAGFAIKLQLLLDNPITVFKQNLQRGLLETGFLMELNISWDDLEPMAENCTKVLVWHTRTEKAKIKSHKNSQKGGRNEM